MTKNLRQQCEALSLELFGKKNFYRRVEKSGLKGPTHDSSIIRFGLTDNEVLAFLQNYKEQKDKHESSQKETNHISMAEYIAEANKPIYNKFTSNLGSLIIKKR